MSINSHWPRNIFKYHSDFFLLYFSVLFLSIYHQKQLPPPSQRVAHCAQRDESSVLVVYPAGGNGERERRREGARVCVWRRSCLFTLDVFSCELGQVSNKSLPPITQCPLRFTLGATERDLRADLKKQLLAEAPGRAIKYLPQKLEPAATRAEKLTEDDSNAFEWRYIGSGQLSLR